MDTPILLGTAERPLRWEQLCHTFRTLLEIIIIFAALCFETRIHAIHLYCSKNTELAKVVGIHTCHPVLTMSCEVSALSAMQGQSDSTQASTALQTCPNTRQAWIEHAGDLDAAFFHT